MNESNSKAPYRFFSNENVELSDIMQPHLESNDKRIIDHEYVLNIQDTSCLNYYYHDSKRDKGHIGTSAQKVDSLGYWLHVGMLCSTDGIPLGLSYQEIWAREAIKNEDKDKKKSRLRLEPIENKESVRWLDGTDACARYAAKGKKVVQVCDREADIFEFMKNCKDKNNSFIVRARSNRSIQIGEKVNQLFSCTKSTPVIGSYKISIEGNSERLPKTVQVNVKYKSIEILPPKTNRPAETYKKFKPIKASFIEVYSRCKVNGQKLHWRLLTNLDVKEIPVEEIIKWYVQRWRIEIFFKSLKSGTKIEICRLTNIESLSKFILM